MPPIDPNELPVGWQQQGIAPAPPPPDPGYKPYYAPKAQPFPGAKMSLPPRQQVQQDMEAARLKLSQNADARAEADTIDAITPETKKLYAQQVLVGVPIASLVTGMGKKAAQVKIDIMNEVSKQAKEAGFEGQSLAQQILHFQAAKAKVKMLETQHGTTMQNEETARLNGQQFIDRSQELPGQTQYRSLNAAIQFAQRHLDAPGHTDVAAMDQALDTFIGEYNKVVNASPTGAGVLSDSSRHEKMAILQGNFPKDQKLAAFNQMKIDMENRRKAQEDTIAKAYHDATVQPDKVKESLSDYAVPSTETKTVPIPEGYQHDHETMLAHHTPGTLTVGQYNIIRNTLDNKYEAEMGGNVHSHLDPAEVKAFVDDYNKGHKHSKIPALNVPLSEEGVIHGTHFLSEKDRANAAAGPLGAGIAATANARTFGLVEGLMGDENRDKLHIMEAANPKAAMIGDIAGSLGAMKGLEKGGTKLLYKIAPNLTVTARKKLLGDILVNTAYGADRGFMGAKDGEGLQGAEEGGISGTAATLVGTAATKGLSPLISEGTSKALSVLKGVDTTTLQKLGLGKFEKILTGLPFVHGARTNAETSFNINNSNRVLQRVGETLPKGLEPGLEMNDHVNKVLNNKYNEIRPQIVGSADGTFENAYIAISSKANTPEKKKMFQEINDAVKSFFDTETGHYDGQGYKTASERLRLLAKTWIKKEGDVPAKDMAHVADQVKSQLQQLVQRQTPEVGVKLKALERAWKHQTQIEDATLVALKTNNGIYSPGDLVGVQRAGETNKRMAARGKAFDQPYAGAGQKVLGSQKVGDVNPNKTFYTVGLAAAAAAGGHAASIPVAPVAGTAAFLAYTPLVKRATQAILLKRPSIADKAIIKRAANGEFGPRFQKVGQAVANGATEKTIRRALEDATRHQITGN